MGWLIISAVESKNWRKARCVFVSMEEGEHERQAQFEVEQKRFIF